MPIDFAKYGGKSQTSAKNSGIKLDFSKYAEPLQPTYQEQQLKFGQVPVDPSQSQVMQAIHNAPRDIPSQQLQSPAHNNVPKDALKPTDGTRPIDTLIFNDLNRISNNPVINKIAEIGRMFYTPGGSAANVAGLAGAAEGAIAKVAPKLAPFAQKAVANAATGFPLGVGQYQSQGGDNTQEALKQGAFGAALGGAGSLAGSALSKSFDKLFGKARPIESTPVQTGPILGLPEPKSVVMAREAQQRSVQPANTDVIYGQGDVQTLGLPQGRYTQPTRMKVNNPTETLDYVMTKIKPQVMSIIEAPTRRDLLVQYIQKNTQIPVDEIHNMKMTALQDLGQNIQKDLHGNMQQIAFDVAKQQGHDLPALLENQAPNLRAQLAKDTQSQVYGVQPPKIGIQKPEFNVTHNADAAMPITKIGRTQRKTIDEFVNAKQEVAATTTLKPKVEPIKGTVTKKEAVQPTLKESAAKTVEPTIVNPAALKPKSELIRNLTPTQKVSGIRANYKNQLDNGNLSPKLKDMIKNTDQSYEKITNKGSDEVAQEAVKNLSKAESDFLLNETGGADHIATGYRLQQKLDAMGEHSRALVVSNKLAKDLTKSGQTQQAASIISRLSPEGQLLNLIRQAERNGKVVSVKDSVEFKAQAKKAKEKAGAGIQANQFTEILDRAAKGEKLTTDDIKKMSDYLASAEKNVAPKAVKVADDLPAEFKEPRKRDRIVSYLDDAEQAALARIKARKNNLNSLPIGEWADHAIVVSSQIAKGSIKAATHVEDMVKLFGEEIRPVATQVYQKAQSMLKRVSPSVGEGDLTKANQAFRRLSGEAEKEKAIVQEMAMHVKKLIADSKAGKLDAADIQKLRDYSDEIAEMTADAKPRELPTQDQRFLQSVKALSKKIAQVETEKMPMDQANREVSGLLRQITKLSDEGSPLIAKQPLDNKALSDIAHDVMEKTRPAPKPTTLQEKIVEKYLKKQAKDGVVVSPKDIDTLRELAKNVTRLSGSEGVDADIAMQKILNSYEKSTPWDKVQAVRYMSMLLNSGTQLVNAASGPIMATKGAVADVFGTMVDIAMHQTLKTPRSVTMYGTNPLRFMADYFKHLIKTGAPAGWHGVSPGGIQNAGEIRGLTFKSNYNPLNWGERALGAVAKGTDYAAYKTIFDSEIRKSGFLDAINSGVKRSDKAAIKAHVEKFVNEPTEAALLDADRIGKNTTFQRSDSTGGKVANFLASGPAVTKPLVGAVVPFVRTPINMASAAVSMTPAGILKGLWQLTSKSKASQREAIRTLSMGVTGTFGTSALGYYLSQIGVITGANDSGDKDVNAIREQAGKGKYRFNQSGLSRYLSALLNGEGADAAEKAAKYQEGDHAFDYNKFQPIAFPLAIGAGLQENKSKPIVGRLAAAGTDAYGSLFGMSTLKGVQDVFQPQYSGTQGDKSIGVASRIAESFFKSFSPSMLAQEARRQDPIVRKTPYNNGITEDVKGYFKSRTPGLSQSMPASKTTLGMYKQNAAGFSGQYINPYKSEIAAYSSAAVIISDLIDKTGDTSLAPSAPVKKVSGNDKNTGEHVEYSIPQDRYEQLQEELGHNIILQITALDPSLTDAKKIEKIKDIYSKTRKTEMDKVKKELGIKISN